MKKYNIIFAFFFSILSSGQIHNPIQWQTSVKYLKHSEALLIAKATLEKKWHLYSQNVPEGPIPTTFSFVKNENYVLIGKTTEPKGIEHFEEVFNTKLIYFENEAIFTQKIHIKKPLKKIEAVVEFMVCNATNCLPPTEVDLVFQIQKKIQITKNKTKKSGWSIFWIAFLSGFAALLTPCVFPMIPMTVSFFIKQNKKKSKGILNAIFYGIFIIVIYVLLGTLITSIFGADALNALSTSVWFNILFFFLLVVFAISFLGAFEITLPASWGTKIDSKADKGGIIGIFFMALALAIVSFSCTGPIVGTLLVQAASQGGILPIIGMLGFSTAIALPFALFAIFPNLLQSLPKSGGWLNTVKVVLGFLELALAFKFLSNADLVTQSHFLEREVFIAIWIGIFTTLALYLFGKIKLPHDTDLKNISVGRLSFGILVLSFVFYMFPGLWGAPLNLISAFPPPQHYSESPYGIGQKIPHFSKQKNNIQHSKLPEGAYLIPPHNILAFKDYQKGIAYAKKINKPAMLDFTGWACVNCRKMEQNVWVKPKILEILKNKIVLISLYVDDKTALKESENSKIRPDKKLKYIGQKWSELQTLKYKANAQPFYVLINHKEQNLIAPIGYTPDSDIFYQWLTDGITNFKH